MFLACDARQDHAGRGAAPTTGQPARSVAAAAALDPALPPTVVRYTGGAQPTQQLPMLVVLHGLGDNPASFVRLFSTLPQPLRVVAVRAPMPYHRGFSWFPVRIGRHRASARAADVRRAAAQLAVWLPQLTARYATRGKPLVSGFSQGGMLAFALLVHHPQRLAAAFPIGGTLALSDLPTHAPAGAPPLFAFHGEADPRVPFAPTRTLVSALQQRGYRAELHAYKGLRHSVSAALRADLFSAIAGAL